MNEIHAASVVTYLPFIYVSMCTQDISFFIIKTWIKAKDGNWHCMEEACCHFLYGFRIESSQKK
jgi:hypothetical protein